MLAQNGEQSVPALGTYFVPPGRQTGYVTPLDAQQGGGSGSCGGLRMGGGHSGSGRDAVHSHTHDHDHLYLELKRGDLVRTLVDLQMKLGLSDAYVEQCIHKIKKIGSSSGCVAVHGLLQQLAHQTATPISMDPSSLISHYEKLFNDFWRDLWIEVEKSLCSAGPGAQESTAVVRMDDGVAVQQGRGDPMDTKQACTYREPMPLTADFIPYNPTPTPTHTSTTTQQYPYQHHQYQQQQQHPYTQNGPDFTPTNSADTANYDIHNRGPQGKGGVGITMEMAGGMGGGGGGGVRGGVRGRPPPVRQDTLAALRKTKFHMSGICSLGNHCNFAHGQGELREKPDLRKTALCNLPLQAKPSYDVSCVDAHAPSELKHLPFDHDHSNDNHFHRMDEYDGYGMSMPSMVAMTQPTPTNNYPNYPETTPMFYPPPPRSMFPLPPPVPPYQMPTIDTYTYQPPPPPPPPPPPHNALLPTPLHMPPVSARRGPQFKPARGTTYSGGCGVGVPGVGGHGHDVGMLVMDLEMMRSRLRGTELARRGLERQVKDKDIMCKKLTDEKQQLVKAAKPKFTLEALQSVSAPEEAKALLDSIAAEAQRLTTLHKEGQKYLAEVNHTYDADNESENSSDAGDSQHGCEPIDEAADSGAEREEESVGIEIGVPMEEEAAEGL
ncbi:unnamed protein product [Vitrella brassicaformis CCMP3155]|uniref:C3H1-type domain-containing protein n=1 Tax=Vitrella brassicaformis (strain CCMP3155) TaxID=1169540 RepID=A0A0G4GCP8_VITBC|nr:unnamed protein product [Vitrella brassicaformis CCMP3155]|eukprot:CEM27047.1 unnamed protein product [Vitrella brassicaformis CCMP3155]